MKTFSSRLVAAAAAVMTASVVVPAQAQYGYSGPGTTRYSGVPVPPGYRAPITPPQLIDPTQGRLYKGVERALPYVKGVRDCSWGALSGGAMGTLTGRPLIGMATGCVGSLDPSLSPWRPLQAY